MWAIEKVHPKFYFLSLRGAESFCHLVESHVLLPCQAINMIGVDINACQNCLLNYRVHLA